MRRPVKLLILTAALLCSTLVVRVSASPLPPPANLFVAVDGIGEQAALPGDNRYVQRARPVAVDFAQLPALAVSPGDLAQHNRLALNLFDDVVLIAELDRVEPAPSGNGDVYAGTVEDRPGSTVALVVRDGQMAGNIWLPGAIYQVRPAGGQSSLHTIQQIDGAALPEDTHDAVPADPSTPTSPSGSAAADLSLRGSTATEATPYPEGGDCFAPSGLAMTERGVSASPPLPLTPSGDATIDLLVAYTPAARERAACASGTCTGDGSAIGLEIDANVALANLSFANSGVRLRLRLVQAVQVDYVESGSLLTDLYRLSETDDGYLDAVHAQRDAAQADLVTLWVASPNGDPQGIAWLPGQLDVAWADALGFSVMAVDRIAPYLVFPHELGHNLGADHDWYSDDNPSHQLYPYSHGQVSPEGGWCTIMSYRSLCVQRGVPCDRIPYWSNPEIDYDGQPTGVTPGTDLSCSTFNADNPPCDADNRLTLNNAAGIVADYRRPLPCLEMELSLVPAWPAGVPGRIRYTLTAHNLGSEAVTGIQIAETLPPGTSYVESSAGPGAVLAGGQIVWSGLACEPQQVLRLQFEVETGAAGERLVHTVQLAADGGRSLPPVEFSTPALPNRVFLPLLAR